MIPKNTDLNPKFFILEEGDIIQAGDEYYNNLSDKWLPVHNSFIGDDFSTDASKPVRRANPQYVDQDRLPPSQRVVRDINGVVIEKGASVLVPEPNDSDIHHHDFVGNVVDFRNGNVVVEDGEQNCFEIEPERLVVDEE